MVLVPKHVSHSNQLYVVFQYNLKGEGPFPPPLSLLCFMLVDNHTEENLRDSVIGVLTKDGIEIKDKRGYIYDNTKSMRESVQESEQPCRVSAVGKTFLLGQHSRDGSLYAVKMFKFLDS